MNFMKSNFVTRFLLVGIATAFLVQSCQKDEQAISPITDPASSAASVSTPSLKRANNDTRTFFGPTVPIGLGVARAYVVEDKFGNPKSVGLNLTENALDGLPTEPASFVLPFPKNKGMHFYDHLYVDWNPHGHEPAGIYDLPHFDVHFYIISSEDRMQITQLDPPAMDLAPDPQYVPNMYMQLPGRVPEMGAHWADLLAPEFNGGTFTRTFIWGSFNGEFIFWEPMITVAYLESHPHETIPVRQPEAYQKDGWYATSYKIDYMTHPGQFFISLSDLVYVPAQ
jgi:hypothetical protein